MLEVGRKIATHILILPQAMYILDLMSGVFILSHLKKGFAHLSHLKKGFALLFQTRTTSISLKKAGTEPCIYGVWELRN